MLILRGCGDARPEVLLGSAVFRKRLIDDMALPLDGEAQGLDERGHKANENSKRDGQRRFGVRNSGCYGHG